MSAPRTHRGTYSDVERVDMVVKQMPILGYGVYYVEAVQAARDALAQQSADL
ncbi:MULTISPECIES: hypothetical protein [unclassified Microbacterium]|uniref:hypothetical protein n=1 Tax=unclassified Microbacterium TaxID=2609290 RepID=UPI00301B2869